MSRPGKTILIVLPVAAALAVVLAMLILPLISQPPLPPPPPPVSFSITSPGGGWDVNIPFSIRGKGAKKGDHIWAVAFDSDDNSYTALGPALIDSGGTWSISVGKSQLHPATQQGLTLRAFVTSGQHFENGKKIDGWPDSQDQSDSIIINVKPLPDDSIGITSPVSGEYVSRECIIYGRGAKQKGRVWIIAHRSNTTEFEVRGWAAVVNTDGSWNASVSIGGKNEAGQTFEIRAVQNSTSTWKPGTTLPDWPDGPDMSEAISVTLQ